MKKLLIASFAVALSFTALAQQSVTVALAPNASTSAFQGSAKITSIIVSATTATNVVVALIDAPTNNPGYINPAYTNINSVVTNVVTVWTNYFGATNTFTNNALYEYSQPNAATTNLYVTRTTLAALANTSYQAAPVSYMNWYGCLVTNTSSGAASVTIQYAK